MDLTLMANALVVSGKCCSPRHLTCPPWHLKPSQVPFSQRDCWGQRQLHRRRGWLLLTDWWFLYARPCRSGCAPRLMFLDHPKWPETGEDTSFAQALDALLCCSREWTEWVLPLTPNTLLREIQMWVQLLCSYTFRLHRHMHLSPES